MKIATLAATPHPEPLRPDMTLSDSPVRASAKSPSAAMIQRRARGPRLQMSFTRPAIHAARRAVVILWWDERAVTTHRRRGSLRQPAAVRLLDDGDVRVVVWGASPLGWWHAHGSGSESPSSLPRWGQLVVMTSQVVQPGDGRDSADG